MSFRFRLQRVLELREKSEQARARTFADASENADTARRHQQAMHDLHLLQRETASAASQGAITAGEMQHFAFLLNQLDARLEHGADGVQEAERLVAEAQTALQSASRDRRVLDRLKERHAERWQEEDQHRDRVDMDEIALTRFARKRRLGDHSSAPHTHETPMHSDRITTPPDTPAYSSQAR